MSGNHGAFGVCVAVTGLALLAASGRAVAAGGAAPDNDGIVQGHGLYNDPGLPFFDARLNEIEYPVAAVTASVGRLKAAVGEAAAADLRRLRQSVPTARVDEDLVFGT